MSLETFVQIFRPAIEAELKKALERVKGPEMGALYQMLAYHMGWEGEGAGPQAQGKRIRPIILLLTATAAAPLTTAAPLTAARGSWEAALPAAAAVELVHNFSLIHDDIEDNSPLRHGRATVWSLWGIAQAINAGDAMYTLAHQAMLDLGNTSSAEVTLQAAHLLHRACVQLTQGQYLDLSYEARGDLSLEAYWPMVSGKTAALLSACTEVGALVGGAPEAQRTAYQQFGRFLGLAFQALDDLLGIWGDAALTGKSADSDLVSGKKSLPILYGLAHKGEFAERWAQGPIAVQEVPAIAGLLEREGARQQTQEQADALTAQALQALAQAAPQGEAGKAIHELALRLLNRQG